MTTSDSPSPEQGLPAPLCDAQDIFRAAAEGDTDAILRHLEAGHSINIFSQQEGPTLGSTPLHLAATAGISEGVRLLLAAGAEPDARIAGTGETPLHRAAYCQATTCARLLLNAGADVNARCHFGSTALDISAENAWYPHSELHDLLLSRGGKTGTQLDAGNSPAPPSQKRSKLREILFELGSFITDEDHPQERAACLDYVEGLLAEHGVELIRRLGSGEHQHLIAALNTEKFRDINNGLMLCGHLDVVPGNAEQFTIYCHNDRFHGRGMADMKGSIACFLHLLPTLAQQNFPVILAFTTDEESSMQGINLICDFLTQNRIRPALTLLGEPTGGCIGTGSSGLTGFCTEFIGKAAHSSRPQDGINALYIAARMLNQLETLGLEFAPRGIYVNAGCMKGGGDPATVPDEATLEWGIRSFSPEQETTFLAAFESALRQISLQYPGCRVETRRECHFPTFRCGEEERATALEISQHLRCSLADIPYTTEAGYLQAAGQRVLLLGAGHPQEAHRDDESIHRAELAAYENALLHVCRMLADQNCMKKT